MNVSRRVVLLTVLISIAGPVSLASAAGWSSVSTPKNSFLSALSCRSTQWCLAVGSWHKGLTAAVWDGRRWKTAKSPVKPAHQIGAVLTAVRCRSKRACVAVGSFATGQNRPQSPLIESWNGRSWKIQRAPNAPAPAPYRATNSTLAAVACPGGRLCFAVGRAVPFGAGNAPGAPLIERWDGSRWRLQSGVQGDSPLTSVSCTSARACTAVGGFEHTTGNATAGNEQVEYPTVVERWDGSRWSAGTFTPPAGAGGAGLLGVACTSQSACMVVGNQESTVGDVPGVDQAIAGPGNGSAFSAAPLAFPAGVDRGGSSPQPPETVLTGVACTTSAQCAAVGRYVATNGALGPLAAVWNGTSWSQTVLRRGPVALRSVACPALGWCLAVGSGISERWIG